jgi:Nucleotide-binding protein implicated in inhibition of septum formation
MLRVSELSVVLASASPRRRDLLDLIGIRHTVSPAHVDESLHVGELPEAYAERLARAKAAKLAGEHPDALIIGADTIVVIDDVVLGKPQDTGTPSECLAFLAAAVTP